MNCGETYKKAYEENLEAAQEYQDFITDQLLRRGIVLNQYASRKYQYERGESASGIEVKFDNRMSDTGNIYIEVDERSNPWDKSDFTPSGIYREDDMWLYLIGNYEKALLLSKKQIRHVVDMVKAGKFRDSATVRKVSCGEPGHETSHGYLFDYEKLEASPWCLFSFKFDAGR